MDLKKIIRTVPDFPKKGILFRDITTLLKDKDAFSFVINTLYERYKEKKVDLVSGIESRGFIIGAALAYKLGCGFVLIRKLGKLPSETISQEYDLEYGSDHLEIHKDAIQPGKRVLLVDDLLATGGTMRAAGQLVERLEGKIVECCCVITLPDLQGQKKLPWHCHYLVSFEGH